jgi:hypothetical protein
MAKKNTKAAPAASTSTAPAPSSPPAKKAKQQAEDAVVSPDFRTDAIRVERADLLPLLLTSVEADDPLPGSAERGDGDVGTHA